MRGTTVYTRQKMESYAERLERKPTDLIKMAVKRMLPKNALARHMLDKLKVYAGPEHPHQAQDQLRSSWVSSKNRSCRDSLIAHMIHMK